MLEPSVQQQVRSFYDAVGWKQIGAGVYQNARYEDLRPVSRDYIHRCHLRLGSYLPRRVGTSWMPVRARSSIRNT